NAIFVLPSSFANRLVSLVFYDTLDHQKELAFAFGGQRSIQLSYGCGAFHLADWPLRGNGWRGFSACQRAGHHPPSSGGGSIRPGFLI
ncbi:MAG: hypothetical protein ACRC9K_22930, partial [Afipia sp.]